MEEKLYDILADLGIAFEKVEHEAFPTVEASGDFYKQKKMGVDCKNIFLRDKRGRNHFLVVIQSDKKVDIPILAEFLDTHRKMSFASDERLEKFLGLKPGSVTPFGIIHHKAKEVKVIVDEDIFDNEFVHFHPLRNTATLKISTSDFRKFLDFHDNEVEEFGF